MNLTHFDENGFLRSSSFSVFFLTCFFDDNVVESSSGIEQYLKTLRQPSVDEFERALTGIVKTYLGGVACTLIRCRFLKIDDMTICWVLVERAAEPVFLVLSDTSKYYVRTGNSTRELNAAEAHDHIQRRGR